MIITLFIYVAIFILCSGLVYTFHRLKIRSALNNPPISSINNSPISSINNPPISSINKHPIPSIHHYVITLDVNNRRFKSISSQLSSQKIVFNTIDAVNGHGIAYPPTMFGGMRGHEGTKGLWLSNIKTYELAVKKHKPSEYIIIYEDDAQLPSQFMDRIHTILSENQAVDIFALDIRTGPLNPDFPPCCSNCIMYSVKILPRLITLMDPYNSGMIGQFQSSIHDDPLFDWYLFYVLHRYFKTLVINLVECGDFPSTMNVS